MFKTLSEWFTALWHDESGHTFLEYSMLVMLIAMAVFGVITATGANLNRTFETTVNKFQ